MGFLVDDRLKHADEVEVSRRNRQLLGRGELQQAESGGERELVID